MCISSRTHIPALSKFGHNNAAPSEKSLPTPGLVYIYIIKTQLKYSGVRLIAIALIASSPISKQITCKMRLAVTRSPLYVCMYILYIYIFIYTELIEETGRPPELIFGLARTS